jgi:signal transduction histidine kinase
MKKLVMKTLELARLNCATIEFEFEPLDLAKEVHTALEKNKYVFDENHITFHNNIRTDLLVHADKLRLSEIFDNILGNAIKFSPHGGSITVNGKENGDWVTVSITDTGIGMTPTQIHKIFNEFYKGDLSRHDFGGSGLGMPICKRIVEKHGGKIWVESQGLGKGTTIFFTLPLAQHDTQICNPDGTTSILDDTLHSETLPNTQSYAS